MSSGDAGGMWLENKEFAGAAGAQLYHAMLTLYEYMEPERNSSQVEWRIVQQLPMYHHATTRPELIREILEGARHLNDYVVKIAPADVEMLICPEGDVKALRSAVPREFSSVPIYSYSRAASVKDWLRLRAAEAKRLLRRRERIVYVPAEPPKGSLVFPKTSNGTLALPPVAKLNGLVLRPNAIEKEVCIDFQYEDQNGDLFEMRMPVAEATRLLQYLLEAHHDLKRYRWRLPNS
jgi:hypothetical protein